MTCDFSNADIYSHEGRAVRAHLRRIDSAAVLAVEGEIDAASVPQLRSAIDQALSDRPPLLVIDLSEVRFFGSAGLSALLVTQEATGAGGLRVVASPQVRRPIEVTGLTTVLDVFDSLPQALGVEAEAEIA